MNSAASIVAIVGIIGLSLANLGCFIYVLIKLFQEKGALHALLGFFCSLYPFIWGWMNASRLEMRDVMLFWTIVAVFGIIVQILFPMAMGTSMGGPEMTTF